MKKLVFTLSVLALLSSCSKDEVMDTIAKKPITFGNIFVEKSTRSRAPEDITYGTNGQKLTKFNVYGKVKGEGTNGNIVNIFNGDDVTGTVGNAEWNCDKVQYWVPGCEYDFIALVDATKTVDGASNSVTVDENEMPASIAYDVRTQADLLFAKAEKRLAKENTGDVEAVDFIFDHLLSKVMFTFTNNFGEDTGVNLTVTDITITNARQSATYSSDANGAWSWDEPTSDEATTSVSLGSTEAIVPGGKTGVCGTVGVLIPGTYTFNITFTVEHNKGGNDTPITVTTQQAVEIEQGNSYNFTAELNSGNVGGVEPIKFNITSKTEWGSDDEVNDDVDYEGEDVTEKN